MQSGKTVLVIPAFNEARIIGKTLEAAKKWAEQKPREREVVLVDDGSADETARVARSHGITVIPSSPAGRNRGKANAFIAGVRCARKKGAQFLLTVDADNLNLSPQHLEYMEHSVKKRDENMLTFRVFEGKFKHVLEEVFSGVRAFRMRVFTPLLKGSRKWNLLKNARFGQEKALNYLIPSRALLDFTGERIHQRDAFKGSSLGGGTTQNKEIKETEKRIEDRREIGKLMWELHHFLPEKAREVNRHFKKRSNTTEALKRGTLAVLDVPTEKRHDWNFRRENRIRRR